MKTYTVDYYYNVRACTRITVKAESEEEAKDKARQFDSESFDTDYFDADELDEHFEIESESEEVN